MCEFDTPNFVYYSYTAVIILTLITGFSILFKDPKRPANRNAFYFISIIALWTFDDLLQWTVHDPFWNMLFAKISYFAYFIVPFFLFFVYYFTYTKISAKRKFILLIPYICLVLLAAYSPIAFESFDVSTCDYVGGSLLFFLFLLDIVYMFWATLILLKHYHDPIIPLGSKRQTKILIIAGWFYLSWGIVYELIGKIYPKIDISPYFVIGNLFFISLIAFAIIKEDLFEFNFVPLNWLVVFIWTSIFAGFVFFATTPLVIILSAIAYGVLMRMFFRV